MPCAVPPLRPPSLQQYGQCCDAAQPVYRLPGQCNVLDIVLYCSPDPGILESSADWVLSAKVFKSKVGWE